MEIVALIGAGYPRLLVITFSFSHLPLLYKHKLLYTPRLLKEACHKIPKNTFDPI